MNFYRPAATLLVLLLFVSIGTEGKGSHRSAQMHFSAEDAGVEKPVSIPPDVLGILRRDGMVRTTLENENMSAEKIPLLWFSASAIHLSSPDKVDLIVVAEEALQGTNVTTFWVFSATPRGYELVLQAPAHDLIIKKARWKGYRDIELTSITAAQIATTLCRFDGERYTECRAKSEAIQ